MSLRHLIKHAAAAAALTGCLLAVPAVQAAEFSGDMQLLAFSAPVSAPCHISLRACAKPERLAAATNGGARVAYPADRWIEPVSAPCHPALKGCRT